jgi:hypothetical protein
MNKTNRKAILIFRVTLIATWFIGAAALAGNTREKAKRVTPMIQATDLYHPHADPDDHFDLACIYALNYWGLIDLKGILIDYPGQAGLNDPDAMAVAQMNYITGLAVPVIIGTSSIMKSREDIAPGADESDMQGINWLLNSLRNSPDPIVVNIVGTATNVAIAMKRDPELFKKKCKAIYLNAGSAYLGEDKRMEYNVELNPSAYAAIFDAPCPVYWLPCFHIVSQGIGEYGSFYQFSQGEVLPFLPRKVQNFFLFMLDRKSGNNWFSCLTREPEAELLLKHGNLMRNMWCTAGFLQAAGKKVTMDGEIVDLSSDKLPVYSFLPVNVTCDDQGYATWELTQHGTNRFIFHINDLSRYQTAMTIALKSLLLHFPK